VSQAHTELVECGPVLQVIFTRDAKLNAISPEMTDALWTAARMLASQDDLRALVIKARGRYFTAGIDLADRPVRNKAEGQVLRRQYRQHHLLYDEFESIEKPIVLAAQGPCLGAGLEMACSCDFRIAAVGARFQLPELALGVIAGSGGTSRLTRLVGPHWAKWLAMASRSVDARQALMMGLVHEVLPQEGFEAAVDQLVREIVTLPGEALGLAKLTVDMCADSDRTTGRNVERLANTQLMMSTDFSDRIGSFLNTRKTPIGEGTRSAQPGPGSL
jgi:enoyl-CoA hydratase